MDLVIKDFSPEKKALIEKGLRNYSLNESGEIIYFSLKESFKDKGVLLNEIFHPSLKEIISSGGIVFDSSLRDYSLTNCLFIGLNLFQKEDLDFLNRNKTKCFSMKEISQEGVYEISEAVMSVAKNFKEIFCLVNTSVLDSAFCPEGNPGGLTPRELIYFIQRIKKLVNFKEFILIKEKIDPLMFKLLSEML